MRFITGTRAGCLAMSVMLLCDLATTCPGRLAATVDVGISSGDESLSICRVGLPLAAEPCSVYVNMFWLFSVAALRFIFKATGLGCCSEGLGSAGLTATALIASCKTLI